MAFQVTPDAENLQVFKVVVILIRSRQEVLMMNPDQLDILVVAALLTGGPECLDRPLSV
jgi:hypothetical protein